MASRGQRDAATVSGATDNEIRGENKIGREKDKNTVNSICRNKTLAVSVETKIK